MAFFFESLFGGNAKQPRRSRRLAREPRLGSERLERRAVLNGDIGWLPPVVMVPVPKDGGEEFVFLDPDGEPVYVPEGIPEGAGGTDGTHGKSDVDELLPPKGPLPAFGPRQEGRWAIDGWKDVGPRIQWVFRQFAYEIVDGVFKARKALGYEEIIDKAWGEGKEHLPDDPKPDTSGEYGDPNRGKVGFPVGPLSPPQRDSEQPGDVENDGPEFLAPGTFMI